MATEKLSIERIKELQEQYGVTSTQEGINSGLCWHMEGSVGRFASSCLESGICFLPEERKQNAYGGTVPSRNDLQDGTKGTLGLAQRFWQTIEDGDINNEDALYDMFGLTRENDELEEEEV